MIRFISCIKVGRVMLFDGKQPSEFKFRMNKNVSELELKKGKSTELIPCSLNVLQFLCFFDE